MEAAFVDLGLPKNGFLLRRRRRRPRPRPQVAPPAQDRRAAEARPGGARPGRQGLRWAPRAPRVTMELSIAGRFLVLSPHGEGSGVSPAAARRRARAAAQAGQAARGQDDGGIIVRTAAAGATAEDLERDLRFLRQAVGAGRGAGASRPRRRRWSTPRPTSSLQGDPRPAGAETSTRCWSTPSASTAASSAGCARTQPEFVDRIKLYTDSVPLFERYGVDAGDPLDPEPPRRPAVRRLPDLRLRRGVHGHRRQHRPVRRLVRPARGHDHAQQHRGGARGHAPAAAARHRRHHRHRLHRHGVGQEPGRGAEGAPGRARERPHEDLPGRDLAARPGRDDAPERDRGRARDPHPHLPDVRRRGRRPLRADDGGRGRAAAAQAGPLVRLGGLPGEAEREGGVGPRRRRAG